MELTAAGDPVTMAYFASTVSPSLSTVKTDADPPLELPELGLELMVRTGELRLMGTVPASWSRSSGA